MGPTAYYALFDAMSRWWADPRTQDSAGFSKVGVQVTE